MDSGFKNLTMGIGSISHPILEGIATGDALGFPYEGVKPLKISWGFVGKWGITSDDTQIAHMAYLALKDSGGDPEKFSKILVQKFVFWFLSFPPTLGFDTFRACCKMLMGLDPNQCGVRSSGNGPLPRAIVLGWELAKDPRLEEFVVFSTELTHKGKEPLVASQALARLVAYIKVNGYPGLKDTLLILRALDESLEWRRLLLCVEHSHSIAEIMQRTKQGQGIGAHAYQTMAVVLWLFLKKPYRDGMLDCVRAGGDTDSAAALLGGLWAARCACVPHVWHRILDFPIAKEPSPKRIVYNLFTALALVFYYVPKRMLGK